MSAVVLESSSFYPCKRNEVVTLVRKRNFSKVLISEVAEGFIKPAHGILSPEGSGILDRKFSESQK